MAPEWTKATRPLVLLFTAIMFLITWLFNADVEAQGGRLRHRRAGADDVRARWR